MHNKQVILFDLDGTLTDSALGIINGARKGLEWFGVQEPDQDKLYKFIGPPLLESYQTFYGMTPQQAEEAVKVYREYYSVTGLFENRVYDGIPEALAALQAAGIVCVLATSKPHVFANAILKHFSLDQYFTFVSGPELDGTRGEKSEVIEYALRELQLTDTKQILMIGDRHHDVLGAKAFGIDCAGVLWGFGSEDELRQAGARYLCQTPTELKKLFADEDN